MHRAVHGGVRSRRVLLEVARHRCADHRSACPSTVGSEGVHRRGSRGQLVDLLEQLAEGRRVIELRSSARRAYSSRGRHEVSVTNDSPIRAQETRRGAERDAPMSQVVRAEYGHAGRPQARASAVRNFAAEPWNTGQLGDAVVVRTSPRRPRKHVRREPTEPARLDGRSAPAGSRLVDVAPGEPLKLAHPHAGRVEHKQRQAVAGGRRRTTASTCSAVGGWSSRRSSRGNLTVSLSRAGFGWIPAWSSTIASTLTVLRIVCLRSPAPWSSAMSSATVAPGLLLPCWAIFQVGTTCAFPARLARMAQDHFAQPHGFAGFRANSRGAYGIRTRAAAVRGQCPRPLDECARRFRF